ncbi:MAG: cytochrome c oxidase subunit 3 family protein [Planctomycetota bacterium]|nr:MAG: cytochrome c oxidase subunit 3 family protein [Planctomycetota bacterium]
MADVTHDAAAAAHEEAHPPHVQHHFENAAQQFDASKFGMWVFLVTEILFFSGLFCAYAVYRRTHPHIFELGQYFLDVKWGAINTVVLITSSFTMALGVWCAQRSYQRGLVWCLSLTLLGAAAFMGIKAIEYTDKIMHGKVWGAGFNPVYHHEGPEGSHAAAAGDADAEHGDAAHGAPASSGDHASVAEAATPPAAHDAAPTEEKTQSADPAASTDGAAAAPKIERSKLAPPPPGPRGVVLEAIEPETDPKLTREEKEAAAYAEARRRKDAHIFLGIYFAMTGLHGIHVLAGMVVIAWLLKGALQGRYHSDYYTPVDVVGLYWHVVDLIWIYLFPLLYLIS